MHGAYCTDIRHCDRGGMLNKTPPPTELQIPATVTTLLQIQVDVTVSACICNPRDTMGVNNVRKILGLRTVRVRVRVRVRVYG